MAKANVLEGRELVESGDAKRDTEREWRPFRHWVYGGARIVSLIHNERTKLLANALDRASTGCLVAGLVGPTVTLECHFAPYRSRPQVRG